MMTDFMQDKGGLDKEPYRGPERRSGVERRQSSDRREEIRFELDKGDRRSGKDRRRANRWGDATLRY